MIVAWNHTKTALLLATLTGLILAGGYLITGTLTGVFIALLLAGGMNIFAYFFSHKIAIAAMRGQEVDDTTAPELVGLVRQLAQRANLPMPKVYICPQEAPNAFATGRSPRHAAVAVTQGALRLLNQRELEGVMGHELAHVQNRDTLISTVAATIAGAITFLGYIFMFGGMGGGRREGGGHPALALLFIFLAPLAAGLIQAAVSRSREFVADAKGATFAGSPDGLISALRKLDAYAGRIPMQHESPAFNALMIVEPLNAFSAGGMTKLFSTHPPTEERVAALMRGRRG